MFISVNHQINNPGEFWDAAKKHLPQLPEPGVRRVCHVFPSIDMTQATCVWEADSVERLDQYLRSKVGNTSTEAYFEINAPYAMGLPL